MQKIDSGVRLVQWTLTYPNSMGPEDIPIIESFGDVKLRSFSK